ncbi:MAG TPA: alpha/beta hydrolase [Ilumatobacteraceae bacterium]|nr:alpha/beta hydrolase [Ilumatobacteraceae bacterium]
MRFIHQSIGLTWTRDGSPSATKVLMLHGLSGISTSYDEVVEQLGVEADVFRIDLRGHGRSDHAAGTYSVPFYAADVVAFIEEVISEPVVLVGHSLGGVITHHITASHPGLVRSALCEDPPLYFCDQALFERSVFAILFPTFEAAMRSAQAAGQPREHYVAMVADTMMPWGRAGDHMSERALQSRADALMLADPDVWGPAIHGGALSGYDPNATITKPMIILQADPTMGPALFPEHAEWQHAANPEVEIRLIEGAPHGIHSFLGSRERYTEALRDIIGRAT